MRALAVPEGCPVREDFDPLSSEFLQDPHAVIDALPLERMPVFYAPLIGYYVVTRHADVEQVFQDPHTFSAAEVQAPLVPLAREARAILRDAGFRPQPSMVNLREYTRLRKHAARAFSMGRVNAMLPMVRATAARLLDAVAGTDEFDLVETLAFPLPATIVFSLLGVPEADHHQLKQWCGDRAAMSWGRPAPEDQVRIASNFASYRRYLDDLVAAKLRQPGDDVTSDLLAMHLADPERLSQDEIATIMFSLSFAGHETTTGLIGNTVYRLLATGQWEPLAADLSLVPAAVEETLRYDPAVPAWRRVTTRPVTLGGVTLPAGAKVFLWLTATGQDPTVFGDPGRFDLRRPNSEQHLAFGRGLHYCLGANLGRLETRIAVTELARRYPRLQLAGGQEVTFHPYISFRNRVSMRLRTGRLDCPRAGGAGEPPRKKEDA
jgi:cytochrome P450